MGNRIETDKELDSCQNDTWFCYLCGRRLVEPLRKPRPVSLEHVIPRAVLGVGIDGCRALKLPVHKQCDEKYKMRDDEVISVFQRFTETPDRELRTQERNALSVLTHARYYDTQTGRDLPLLPVRRMCSAVETWVKGMHAALYREPPVGRVSACPPANSGHTPRPSRGSMVIDYSDVFGQAVTSAYSFEGTKLLIEAAIASNSIDKVVAWNGGVQYLATWKPQQWSRSTPFPWRCLWLLLHPGIENLSQALSGELRCWWGMYETTELPPGASTLTVEMVRSAARRDPAYGEHLMHVYQNIYP